MMKLILRSRCSKWFGLTFIFLFPLILSAQHTISITGTVQQQDGEPLSFATVAAHRSTKSEVLQGVYSDGSGKFQLAIPALDSVYIAVSLIGYITQGLWVYPSGNTEIDAIILETDPQRLEAVVVTGRRNRLTREIDRLVVDVQDNAAYAGRPAMALLSSVPGVFVQDGEISINGVYGTRVMINGRLLQLTGDMLKNYLANLKADDIKSVEVIAHPPAEYDAEGSGGLINIILKKNTDLGFTASVGHDYLTDFGRYLSYRPNASFDYRKGKFNLSGGYNYFWEEGFQYNVNERDLADDGDFRSTINSITQKKYHEIRFSAIYDISDKQFIGFDYNGEFGGWGYDMESTTTIDYPSTEDNIYSLGEFPFYTDLEYTNVGLNYVLKTDTLGSALNLVADLTYLNSQGESGTDSETFGSDGGLLQDTAYTFYYPSVVRMFTAEAKYNKKYKNGTALSFGGKLSSNRISNVNTYGFENGQPDQHAFDYDYDEDVYAAFISLNGVFKGLTYNLGLRGEQSRVYGDVVGSSQDTTIQSNYFNFFPNVSLQRTWDNDNVHTTTLSYSKRIARPSFQQLNPYQYFVDNYSVSTGNPYLTPQFRHSIELGHMFKERYYLAFSYSHIENMLNQVMEVDATSDLITVLWRNSGVNRVFAATLNAPFDIAKWWTTTNSLLLTHTELEATEFHLSQYSYVAQTEQKITLPKGFGLNLSAFYTPRFIFANLLLNRRASVDLGVRKMFFGDRLAANINVSDIFNTGNDLEGVSTFNGNEVFYQVNGQSRMVTVSLKYNINIGKAFKARGLEKSNTEEIKRL